MSNEILRNLFWLLTVAWRRCYMIVIPMLIMPVIGFMVSFIAPKFYESHTTILLQDTIEKKAAIPVINRLPIMLKAPMLIYDASSDTFNGGAPT